MASPVPPPPPPPPPPGPQGTLHCFDLPEWPSKKRTSGGRPTRWRRQPHQLSASSALQKHPSGRKSTILPWLTGETSRAGSSSSSPVPFVPAKAENSSESDSYATKSPTDIRIKVPSSVWSRGESSAFGGGKPSMLGSSTDDAFQFLASDISEKESSCIEVLQRGLPESKVQKGKTLEKNKSKTLVKKSQGFEAIDFTFEQLVNKFVADLSVSNSDDNQDNKKNQEEMESYMLVGEKNLRETNQLEDDERLDKTGNQRSKQQKKLVENENLSEKNQSEDDKIVHKTCNLQSEQHRKLLENEISGEAKQPEDDEIDDKTWSLRQNQHKKLLQNENSGEANEWVDDEIVNKTWNLRSKQHKKLIQIENRCETNQSEDDEIAEKTWNLRSKQHKKLLQNERLDTKPGSSSAVPKGSIKEKSEKQPKIAVVSNEGHVNMEARSNNKGKKAREKKKAQIKPEIEWPKFRLQLTPQEIEEDLYAMTGKRPTRRIKKRPKNVQKNIDRLSLGAELEHITPESYEVNEKAAKGK